MEKQILDLLSQMYKEMQGMKTDMQDMKTDMQSMKSDINSLELQMHKEMDSLRTEMHSRFDTVDTKLEGIGGQFELTNQSRINDVDFITDKVNKLEKELFLLKNNKDH